MQPRWERGSTARCNREVCVHTGACMHTFVEVQHRCRVAWEAGADDVWMKSVRRGRDKAHRCGRTRTGAWMQGHGGCRATWTRWAWTTVGVDRGDSKAC